MVKGEGLALERIKIKIKMPMKTWMDFEEDFEDFNIKLAQEDGRNLQQVIYPDLGQETRRMA